MLEGIKPPEMPVAMPQLSINRDASYDSTVFEFR